MTGKQDSLHATLVLIGEAGVLITGPSGAGKSALALALLGKAAALGRHARLIGDDRVQVTLAGGRVIGRGHPRIPGQIEARGAGIMCTETAESAVLHAVLVLDDQAPRLPAADNPQHAILGVALPAMALRPDQDLDGKAHLVLAWLDGLFASAKKLLKF